MHIFLSMLVRFFARSFKFLSFRYLQLMIRKWDLNIQELLIDNPWKFLKFIIHTVILTTSKKHISFVIF